jgi:hypothetical protein
MAYLLLHCPLVTVYATSDGTTVCAVTHRHRNLRRGLHDAIILPGAHRIASHNTLSLTGAMEFNALSCALLNDGWHALRVELPRHTRVVLHIAVASGLFVAVEQNALIAQNDRRLLLTLPVTTAEELTQ